MRLRRLSTAAIAAVTAAALLAVAPGGAQAAPSPVAPRITAQEPVGITLITGDRVTTTASGALTVQRGPGREKITFVSRTQDGHRYVFPADALPLVRAGRVDQRLFDITALTEFGYTGSAELPLLVSYPDGKAAAGVRAITAGNARVTRDLPKVGALAMRTGKDARAALWTTLTGSRAKAAGVERIWLDGKRKLDLDVSVPQIGAPAAWQAGFDGTGVTVAVLDSGIDATHPDFAGRIAAAQNFSASASADDEVGHGTHVASIIAGSGAKSGGKYRGVAPGAKLAIGKVCETEWCEDSAILAGMEWAAGIAPVINVSLGGGDTPGLDPLEQAVEDLTAAHGTLFVIAAGNSGSAASIGSPGSADSALTVGAVDREDQLAEFSSRGPRVGDDAIKPDLTAPGVDIVAAEAANGFIGDPAADGYVALSGTSMATPHVAGAAAILAQQHPGWSPKQRKNALIASAKPAEGVDVFAQGSGRVDLARGITQTVTTDEGSLSFGRQQWPHDDDVPVTRTVTYRNTGTAPVTLTLDLETDAAETFELAASTLTVPAGGTASTTLTADTRAGDTDGLRSGHLVATSGDDVRVITAFAVNREVESYDVTFTHIGRDGAPTSDYLTSLTDLDTGDFFDVFGGEPTTTVRLPKGEYGMFTWLFSETDTTFLVQTRLVVDGPDTIRLDGRRGKPMSVTVPRKDATGILAAVNAGWTTEAVGFGAGVLADDFSSIHTAQIGSRAKEETFFASLNGAFAKVTEDGSAVNTPYTYSLSWGRKGAFYNGFTKAVQPGELATLRTTFAAEADVAGVQGVKGNYGDVGDPGGGWSVLVPSDLPGERTEWLNTDSRALWSQDFYQELPPVSDQEWPETISGAWSAPKRFDGGATYRDEWNRAVFAPSVGGDIDAAVRYENLISVGVPLFSEGSGHWGYSAVDTARTALYSGANLIGETTEPYGDFEVPAGDAAYRLETTVTRGAPHRFSTTVSGTWTFRSGTTEDVRRLPLSTVRISPVLDDRNTAPAGRAYDVPLTVERATKSGAKANRELTAQVSYDDGATWSPATVTGTGDHRVAKVTHPAGPGFVSLRVTTKDAAGNTAAITVLRAYAIG